MTISWFHSQSLSRRFDSNTSYSIASVAISAVGSSLSVRYVLIIAAAGACILRLHSILYSFTIAVAGSSILSIQSILYRLIVAVAWASELRALSIP